MGKKYPIVNGLKKCHKCEEIKPTDEYYFFKSTNKYCYVCKKCKDAHNKKRALSMRKFTDEEYKIHQKALHKKYGFKEGNRFGPKFGKGSKHPNWKGGNPRIPRKRIPIETIQLVYEDNIKKYGTLTCYLCLKKIVFGDDELEHKVPISRGGNDSYDNLGISCSRCNRKKHMRTDMEYRSFVNA